MFPSNLNASLDFVSGNIEILGKQNSLFPSGPVIKCSIVQGMKNKELKFKVTKKTKQYLLTYNYDDSNITNYNKCYNHKNYNFLACDWFKNFRFSTNSLAKLLSDSLLLDSLLLDSLLSDSLISQSHSKM